MDNIICMMAIQKLSGLISFYFHEAEFNIEPELYDYGNEVFWI